MIPFGKYLYLISALYVLILIGIPCGDNLTGNCGNHTEQSSGDENHHDCCSPFCSCQCCHVVCDFFQPAIQVAFTIIPETIFIPLKSEWKSVEICSIWSPPKDTV